MRVMNPPKANGNIMMMTLLSTRRTGYFSTICSVYYRPVEISYVSPLVQSALEDVPTHPALRDVLPASTTDGASSPTAEATGA